MPQGVKIVILHELKNDEGIRLFLQEVWEAYVKVCHAVLRLGGAKRRPADILHPVTTPKDAAKPFPRAQCADTESDV